MEALLLGNNDVVFSLSGIVASLETGFAPQSLQADYAAKSKEFVNQKGQTITDALYSPNGTGTVTLLFLGGTLPDIGDFLDIDDALFPLGSGDWYVTGFGAKGEAEGAVMADVKFKRHDLITAPVIP